LSSAEHETRCSVANELFEESGNRRVEVNLAKAIRCFESLFNPAVMNFLLDKDGQEGGYRERLFRFVEAQSAELSFSERIAPAKGLSHGGRITLLSGMQPAEEFSTLVHEIAHEMLHRGERRAVTTKQVRETEAEAVAFVVCQSVGLQNGTASQDYIQLWHGDANLLRESLEAVQQTAAVILGGIAPEPAALAAALNTNNCDLSLISGGLLD